MKKWTKNEKKWKLKKDKKREKKKEEKKEKRAQRGYLPPEMGPQIVFLHKNCQ